MSIVCKVQNLNVDITEKSILKDVNFEIEEGEFTGLIGSNGSGKSTLLRSILGTQPGATGVVAFGDTAASKRGRSIGYVPQKTIIDPEIPLRARDLVALGLDATKFGIRRRSPAENDLIDKTLSDVNAQEFANQRVGTLSGGQLQRILIAHAIVTRPSLLLLDEPLANLDPRSVQEIVLLLHNLALANNVAILISSHEINPLLQYMDKVIYLSNSRVAHGTTEEVIQSKVLSKLYGYHVDVLKIHDRIMVLAEPNSAGQEIPDHPSMTII